MEKSELNSDDLMKGIEDMLKGTPSSTSKTPKIEVTDPEEFAPHERLIAKDLHAISHLVSITTEEMLLSLKRIIYFIEHHQATTGDDSKKV